MATLTLRTVKGSPLTNAEVDGNFTALNTELSSKLSSSDYTASDVLTKLKTVDGAGSGLDADTLDGLNAASTNTASTIVARDSSGNFAAANITATRFTGPLTGNVTGNVTGDVSGNVVGTLTGNVTGDVTGNVTGTAGGLSATLGVNRGGTGATTLTGILKGNGVNAFTAATAGTDFLAPATPATISSKYTYTGTMSIQQVIEKSPVSATAASGTVNFDLLSQAVLVYTSNATGNWTLNVRGDSSTSLNSLLAAGETVTIAFMVNNGSTAYYQSGFSIDGNAVTVKWQNGSAPTSGNVNSTDVYTMTITKTATGTYSVLGSVVKFA